MAESSSKQSIEDVLSSIRRLVRDEGASVAKPAPPTMGTDKLVLTPQLRVTEPEDPYQTIRALAQTDAPASAEDEPSLEDAPDADVLMPIFVTEQRRPPAFGMEPADGDAAHVLDTPAEATEGMAPRQSGAHETAAKGTVLFEVVSEITHPNEGDDDTDEVASEVHTPEAGQQPDLAQQEATAEAMPELHAAAETITLDEAAMDQPFETTEQSEEAIIADHAPDAGPFAPPEESAPLEGMPAAQVLQEDPPEGADLSSGAIPFPHDKIARDGAADAAPAAGQGDQADDVLDEETLREIIAEVVREEFAGQLGERITRNVRKLVRREIRQMLASEDLD